MCGNMVASVTEKNLISLNSKFVFILKLICIRNGKRVLNYNNKSKVLYINIDRTYLDLYHAMHSQV